MEMNVNGYLASVLNGYVPGVCLCKDRFREWFDHDRSYSTGHGYRTLFYR